MKNRRLYIYSLLLIFITISCNEKEFLDEKPIDFLSPSNSFVTNEDFTAAVYQLHVNVRDNLWGQRGRDDMPRQAWYGTDIALTYFDTNGSNDFKSRWGPQGVTLGAWESLYRVINNANIIIDRSLKPEAQLTPEQQLRVEAEARFFRGFSYAKLGYLWGGVPITLHETLEPKRNYVRSSRQETYQQAAEDLKFAADNLPGITETEESRINNLAASHYLAEVYLAMENWQGAVDEASKVIDDPATSLMTERFGTRVNEAPNPEYPWASGYGKDVYWDLFRRGNQNRSIGNKESIWVLQYEYNVDGGGDNMYELERFIGPFITRASLREPDGSTTSVVQLPSTYYMGRAQGFIRPSDYFLDELWEKSGYDEDIRNASYNIIRDIKVNNPNSVYDGMYTESDNLPVIKETNNDTMRYYYPMIMKVSTPSKHPDEFWDPDQTIPGTLLGSAEQTWRKHYMVRLAGTYLLRAEAYLGMGDKAKAAEDINMVRRRAKAPDVAPADVDIDYIMDEQMRELHFETLRIFTLGRLGKIVERNREVNPIVGSNMADYQNLWAIPFSEIQRNTGAVLEQNPGY